MKIIQPEYETEWLTSLVILYFGLSLAHPDSTFSIIGYQTTIGFLNESVLSTALIVLGLTSIICLKINGDAPTITGPLRLILSVTRLIIYTVFTACFINTVWNTEPMSTAAATYGIMGWFEIKIARRLHNGLKLVSESIKCLK